MALYLEHTGTEFLANEGKLDQDRLLRWFRESRKIPAAQGAYYSKLLDSGLEIIFRTVKTGDDLQIVGVDMHMSGRCVWKARPLSTVGIGEPLAVSLLLTDVGERCAFVADLVHAATLGQIDGESDLSLQVCAFPSAMDVYDGRTAYEQAMEGQQTLEDGKLLPFNYIMARDENVGKEARDRYASEERQMMLCGKVLAVDTRGHGVEDASCQVATVKTEMGHLDLVYTSTQLGRDLEPGSYVVASCRISADVLAQ
jgi:hypothetical protein